MLGTIVNTCTILTGSCVGSFLGRGISEKYKTALFDALGLATVGLGANAVVQNMPKSEYPVLFIASLVWRRSGLALTPLCRTCPKANTRCCLSPASPLARLSARGWIFTGILTVCLPKQRAAASWRRVYPRQCFCFVSVRCRYWARLKAA